MKTKTIQDKATISTIIESVNSELTILAEEMRSWADNMSGTGLENTMKYEQVEEVADQLEEAQSTIEIIKVSDELGTKEISYSYTMPQSRYIGRSWRLGQIISALRATAENLPEGEIQNEILSTCDELDGIDFPGMY